MCHPFTSYYDMIHSYMCVHWVWFLLCCFHQMIIHRTAGDASALCLTSSSIYSLSQEQPTAYQHQIRNEECQEESLGGLEQMQAN